MPPNAEGGSEVAPLCLPGIGPGIGGGHMNQLIERMRNDERGLTTAEYAVGTVAAAGFGGVLIKVLTSPEVRNLIWKVVSGAFSIFF